MAYLTRARQIVEAVGRIRALEGAGAAVTRGPERVPEVNELRSEIKALGVPELRYFEEGLDCIAYAQASRAAIVMGWTGYIDLLQKKMADDGFLALNGIMKAEFRGVYNKAGKITAIDELAKYFDDSLLLQAAKKLGIVKSHAYMQLDAMRDERNNCAHVEEYAVTERIALGFYAKLITYLPFVL
jgi:hypothetical protein